MPDLLNDAEVVMDDELMFDDVDALVVPPGTAADCDYDSCVYEGEVLLGKYRIEHSPDRRGLDMLVDVHHLELASSLTLKYLAPDACHRPELATRFLREAREASQVRGEHVACVLDAGRLAFGSPYLVRESLQGPDLAEVVKVRGPLPVAVAVDYILQASEGVAEGHAVGIVHRNLRPTTLVAARRSDGSSLVKVFDFAATEPIHVDPWTERAAALVGTSAVMSSVPYMAPEQIREPNEVDLRADIYALGAILHELLAAAPVFTGENAAALVAASAADAPRHLHELRDDVPSELDAVVQRCLAKSRADRFESLAQLVLALEPFGSVEARVSVARVLHLAGSPFQAREPDEPRLPTKPPRAEPWPSVEPKPEASYRASARHPEQDEASVIGPAFRHSVPGGLARSSPAPRPRPARFSAWALVAAGAAVLAFFGAQRLGGSHPTAPRAAAVPQPSLVVSSPGEVTTPIDVAPPQERAEATPAAPSSVKFAPRRMNAVNASRPVVAKVPAATSGRAIAVRSTRSAADLFSEPH